MDSLGNINAFPQIKSTICDSDDSNSTAPARALHAMKFSLFPLVLTLLIVPLAAWAQETPATNAQAPEPTVPLAPAPDEATLPEVNAAPSKGYVEFGADDFASDDPKGITVFTGNVTATQKGEDFILYAQKAISFDKTNTATATKDLRIETRESTIRGEKLFADFNTKIFSITGSVVVSSYGENDGVAPAAAAKRRTEQKREPVRIACDRLDWNYDTRQAILVGNIRIVQGDGVGTCNQIIYDEPKNAARLLGNVRFGNIKKQQFLTDELTLFVDSGQTQTNAGVRMIGPVNNAADGVDKPAPKTVEAFPTPATIGDNIELPKPPPDIEKFLPKPGVPTGKPPVIPAEKPAPPAKPEPETAPATEPVATEPITTEPTIDEPEDADTK